eukprot:1189082-Prorocentrum_minimum.AAC.5
MGVQYSSAVIDSLASKGEWTPPLAKLDLFIHNTVSRHRRRPLFVSPTQRELSDGGGEHTIPHYPRYLPAAIRGERGHRRTASRTTDASQAVAAHGGGLLPAQQPGVITILGIPWH